MLVILVAIALLLCLVHVVFNYNETARLIKKIPGGTGRFIVGNALDFFVPPVELFALGRIQAQKFNGIYGFYSFPLAAVNIYNPEDIEIIMSSMNYIEKSLVYRFLKPWLGDGLLVSNGLKWHERRKILTPAFHFKTLRQYYVILEENSQRLINTIEMNGGEPVDITPLLSDYALNAICETAMGTRLREENKGKHYKEALYKLGKLLVERFVRVYLYSDFIFNLTSIGKKQKKYLKVIHTFTQEVIEERREYTKKHGIVIPNDDGNTEDVYMSNKKNKRAMLDLLLCAQKDGLIDDNGIREEVDTFMFEGHDTTAAALIYCLMLIANHKHVQDKIVAELRDVFGNDTKRVVTIEELSSLGYLSLCIKESLRLYPSVPFISRTLNEETILSNYKIPKGTICHIHIYDLHRREDLFKNALQFDPDRFLPENSVGRHPYSYIPFSAGPRNCIGQKFAILEMKSILSSIIRKYEVLPVTKPSDIVFTADLILRTVGPIYVKFVKREM